MQVVQTIVFQLLTEHANVPFRQHEQDAGFDLATPSDAEPVTITPGEHCLVPLGYAAALPRGTVGLVCPRSGLAAKHRVTVLNAPGIIDAGYRGELKVALVNHGGEPYTVSPGDRVAQLVVTPFLALDTAIGVLDASDRGVGGFGSTGVSPFTGVA